MVDGMLDGRRVSNRRDRFWLENMQHGFGWNIPDTIPILYRPVKERSSERIDADAIHDAVGLDQLQERATSHRAAQRAKYSSAWRFHSG